MEYLSRTLYPARVRFADRRITDLPGHLARELSGVAHLIPPGGRIAVAVGSRGIDNLALIVRQVCALIKERGGEPFIIPAMGSHGGATGPGQAAVLAGYGITGEAMGAPVCSSMETVELDRGDLPCRLFMDRHAWEADGVVLINRIKPHTDFRSDYESGLVKMAVIGLGKQDQAEAVHAFGARGLSTLLMPAARRIFATGKVLFGVGLVEDALDHTAQLRAIPAGQIIGEEPGLLAAARSGMARLPVDRLDLLLVDRIGKDISGTCMDTNVIGRMLVDHQQEPGSPRIDLILADDLTPASHGNALGVGLADIITRRLHDKINLAATYENVLTSGFLHRGKLPLIAENAAQALTFALRARGRLSFDTARIIRVRSTLHLEELLVSAPVAEELRDREDVAVADKPVPLFDVAGDLAPWPGWQAADVRER